MKTVRILKNHLVLIFLIIFSFVSCNRPKKPDYSSYLNKISVSYLYYIKDEYGLYCYGKGGGFINNINKLSYTLSTNQKLDTDSARVIVVNCVEELLKRINENEGIRPYLAEYPFPSNRISITISSDRTNDSYHSKPNIALVSAIPNKGIFYKYYDPEKGKFKTIHRETYQEALEIVKSEGKLNISALSISHDSQVVSRSIWKDYGDVWDYSVSKTHGAHLNGELSLLFNRNETPTDVPGVPKEFVEQVAALLNTQGALLR